MKNEIRKYDNSNMFELIKEFYKQIKQAVKIADKIDLPEATKPIKNVILCGMGGSAIGGDILKSYIKDEISIPFIINREYQVPEFVNQNSLALISSYSGNTEETITAFHRIKGKTGFLTCITSGGELENLAKKDNIPIIKIPKGYQPRAALGFSFFPLLIYFTKLGIIRDKQTSINETIDLLAKLSEEYSLKEDNVSQTTAHKLMNTLPVIYACSPLLEPIAMRWKCQICENSKMLAFHNTFPELDHNEICGWESYILSLKNFTVIILRDNDEEEKITKRIEFTKEIIAPNCKELLEFYGGGISRLARMFSLVYLGDFISFYLAILNKKDPTSIKNIETLKEKLAENEE